MDAANVAGFTWSMERFQGYFPLGQRKYDFSGGQEGQTLTSFIKIQYFHWDKKKYRKTFLFTSSYVSCICFYQKIYSFSKEALCWVQRGCKDESNGGPVFRSVVQWKGHMCVNFLKYEVLTDEHHKRRVQIKGYWNLKEGKWFIARRLWKFMGEMSFEMCCYKE